MIFAIKVKIKINVSERKNSYLIQDDQPFLPMKVVELFYSLNGKDKNHRYALTKRIFFGKDFVYQFFLIIFC